MHSYIFHYAATGNDYIAMRIAAVSQKPCFIRTNRTFYSIFAAIRETESRFTGATTVFVAFQIHNSVFSLSPSLSTQERIRVLSFYGGLEVSDWFPATSQPRLLDSTSNSARNRVTKPWATAWRGIRLNYCPAGSFVYSGIHYPAIEHRRNFRAQFVSPALARALCNRESSTPSRSRPPVPDARPTLVINNFPFRRISRSLNRDIRSALRSSWRRAILEKLRVRGIEDDDASTRFLLVSLASKSRYKVEQILIILSR